MSTIKAIVSALAIYRQKSKSFNRIRLTGKHGIRVAASPCQIQLARRLITIWFTKWTPGEFLKVKVEKHPPPLLPVSLIHGSRRSGGGGRGGGVGELVTAKLKTLN